MRLTTLTPELWENFKKNARALDIKEVLIQCPNCTWDFKDVEGGCAAVSEDGKTVYAVGGVQHDLYEKVVWMLCTNAVNDHKIEFLRFTKTVYEIWINGNRHMGNYVWLGNDLHVKWLKWLGAKFSFFVTINNEPFQRFDFYKE